MEAAPVGVRESLILLRDNILFHVS